MTESGSDLKDTHLPVLYDFARTVAAVFDIQTLMTHFFNVLKTAVDFDAGAYFVNHDGVSGGRLYVTGGLDKKRADDLIRDFSGRIAKHCPEVPQNAVPAIEVSRLMERAGGERKEKGCSMRSLDIPLEFQGRTIGVITLASYGVADPFTDTDLVFSMAAHANSVLERLLSRMFAEERKLSDILMNMSEGVYILDGNGHFTAVNPRGLELVEGFCDKDVPCVSASPGERTVFSGCDCGFTACVRRFREGGSAGKVRQEEIKNKEGRIFALTISALSSAEGYLITAKDVTEERLLQKRMMLSSKLASLGEMAAGVAHEINNPLQAILCNIELLEYDTNDSGHRRLKRVRDGVLRIKSIIKDLLIFAREHTTETEDADINTVIEKSHDILKNQLRMANVRTQLQLFPNPAIARINRNMFQQVIINLLQNARDAITDSGVGSAVTIRTELFPGREVVVEVSDDGPGIPEEIMDRIFDPFFTTKDVGKGTGLGLSVSRKIIEGMEGTLTASSSKETGTVFRITLPHSGIITGERRGKKRREYDPEVLRNKSVLMVDDDGEVLKTVSEALARKVFFIDPAANSMDAYGKITERDYDFIFLDIKMPGMDGMELFRLISETRPHLTERVIFITGDIESKKTAEFLKLTGCRHLAKPFAINELLEVMSEMSLRAERR